MKEYNKEKISSVVSKILRETQEGLIKWDISHINEKSDIQQDDDTRIIGNIYTAKIDNKNIRLFERKIKTENYNPMWGDYASSGTVILRGKEPTYKWITYFRLEFYNASTQRSEWIFPSTNAISDLYEVVCAQTSEVGDFFSQYLNEE